MLPWEAGEVRDQHGTAVAVARPGRKPGPEGSRAARFGFAQNQNAIGAFRASFSVGGAAG